MTDSNATELLPCPFCGGEAEVIEADYGMYMTGYAVYCRKCCLKLGVTGRLGETYEWSPVFDTEAEAIAAWNTRVTGGTLTAKQVRDAIIANTYPEQSTILEFNDSSWQAIADELNAALGSGTCELAYGEDDEGYDGWYCQSCGGWFDAVWRDGRLVEPTRCGCCGKAVKR